MRQTLLASMAVFAASAPCSAQTLPPVRPPELIVAAESHEMIWNAVAVHQGRIFVAGPRWTGSKGPAVAVIGADGKPQAYPDENWNAWKSGSTNDRAFVNVNALHLDRAGGLWVIDTGSPDFGGDPLPGGAKLVKIDLATNQVTRVISLGPEIAKPGSYVDDVRFKGDMAYLTDAGNPGLIVLNVPTGKARRVLDGHVSTTAANDRPVVLSGEVIRAPDGKPLKVNSDPLELSPDGAWLHYAALPGPWYRVETRWLDDPTIPNEDLAKKVQPWADIPPVGGSVMASDGSFFFTDLAEDALKRRDPDGTISTVVRDERLHWVDAPFIDDAGSIWLPVPQMDRVGLFNGGRSLIRWPVQLFRLPPQARR